MATRNAAVSTAQDRVDRIRERLGYPSQEYLDTLDEKQREGLFKLLESKDNLIGNSVVSLAKSLYTSQARFVFELLQNSEDNQYSKALSRNEAPQVTFHLYHDRVVQECNEDGFDEVNLTAICNVGQSSKKTSQNYIGEKGIGFKSVFMVAYKAYIQSGDYSFYFEHRPGDNGMGMVAPQWEDTEEDLGDHFTRITLSLHDTGTEAELAAQYQMIREQFESVHEAILLFMKKLRTVKIVFYEDKQGLEAVEKIITFSLGQSGPKTTVTKTTTVNDETRKEVKHYFTSTHLATNLPKNTNRDYTEEDIASQTYSTSQITLAFPLTGTDEPLLLAQWVFAYLPACRLGFKFIIQADFETQANREGIVITAPRNKSLMSSIAVAFIQAVQNMQEIPFLRFKWMRYLPREIDFPWDETWSILVKNIRDLLANTQIMQPANEGTSLKYLRSSRQHAELELDGHGKPLLPDKTPNLYISLQYERRDLDLLRNFGLSHTHMNEIIARAREDLARPDSRMKTSTDDVQSRIARLLTLPFMSSERQWQEEVQQLEMLQLQNGDWCAAYDKRVYFSGLVDTSLAIPDGLRWLVLDRSVGLLPDIKKLFKLIGVESASVSDVRKAIGCLHDEFSRAFYPASSRPFYSLNSAVNHLRFLYLTDHLVQDHEIYSTIRIWTRDHHPLRSRRTVMYIWNKDPHSVASLFEANAARGAPGMELCYMHNDYLEDPPDRSEKQPLDWTTWLHNRMKIRRMAPLLNSNKTELSGSGKYLAQYRPDRFLAFLQLTWKKATLNVENYSNIVNDILDVSVICCRTGSSERTVQLRNTYLPLEKLVGLCDRFLIEEDFFPFLKIDRPLSHGTSPREWEALGKSFGLGYNENDLVGFLLDLANEMMTAAAERLDEPNPQRVYDFYLYLQAECRQSNAFEANCEKIRLSALGKTIFVPTDNEWDETSLCVWEAPGSLKLQKRYSLTERFGSSFKNFESDKALMKDLFVNMLGIAPNCTWQDLVDELRFCKLTGKCDFDSIHRIYECIFNFSHAPQVAKQMRDMFAEETLIYDPTGAGAWFKTSLCLWSSETTIRGMFAVNTIYEDLERFFVNTLDVQTLTVGIVYEKLIGDTTTLSADDIKSTLMVFSTLLKTNMGEFDPKPMLKKKLLPVISPSGELELCMGNHDFVIRDRQQLSDDFAQKVWFLDFNLDSTRRLSNFIVWAGLENRYVSEATKEICSVDVESTKPISNVYLQISQKAHALTRIAATFESPRLQGNSHALYRLLKNSQTLETSRITSTLTINQSDTSVTVEKESASLYIPDHATELIVYLTNDEIEQESCFNTKLPRRLAQWIMSEPDRPSFDHALPEMVAAVQSVLSVSRRALPTVLDEHGIVQIDVEDESGTTTLSPEIMEQDTFSTMTIEIASQALMGRNERASISIRDTRTTHNQAMQLTETAIARPSLDPPQIPGRESLISDLAPTRPGPPNNRSRQLWLHVAEAARQTSFPTRTRPADGDALETYDVQESNHTTDRFDLSLYHKLERDKRVGAAGELFVFELLLQLLPNFGIDNWKSNIRHYVDEHPEYAGIQRWNGWETSDIVYQDSQGVLTNLLVNNGYLEGEQWTDTTLEYYLEVKSTTSKCKAPFYMSNSQYGRMHRFSNTNTLFWNEKKLYVIFRVYNLTQDAIGLEVLVDPASLANEGLLSFTPETWSGVIT